MNAATRYHLFLTKSLLWIFFGAGLAVAILGVPASLEPVAATPIWIGVIGALLYLVIAAVELFQDRDLRALRWLVALLAVGGFVATADPFVPALATLSKALAVFSVVALVCLYVLEATAGRKPEEGVPFHTGGPAGGFIGGYHFGAWRQAALTLVIGLVAGVVITELAEARGPFPAQKVREPWTVQAVKTPHPYGEGTMLTHQHLTWNRWDVLSAGVKEQHPDAESQGVLLIDGGRGAAAMLAGSAALPDALGGMVPDTAAVPGNRADTYVLFDHAGHQERQGGDASCVKCHHRNVVLDRGTSCRTCHQYKYRATNTFDHDVHVERYGGNQSCAKCHAEGQPKTMAGSKSCSDCHPEPDEGTTAVRITLDELGEGWAVGYVDAMHGLCINCHLLEEAKQKAPQPYLSRCINCHRERPDADAAGGVPAKTTIAAASNRSGDEARR